MKIANIIKKSLGYLWPWRPCRDLVVRLCGDTADHSFSIKNWSLKTLFKVNGLGNVGVGIENPEELFNVNGEGNPAGPGRSIRLKAEDSGLTDGGNIGLMAGESSENGGSINIVAGDGHYDHGGDVLIKSGNSEARVGDINIITPDSNLTGGSINLYAQGGNAGESHINLKVGHTETSPNTINLLVEPGGPAGGNITITPGVGEDSNGLLVVTGSGTYSGSWTLVSDKRFKKNFKPIRGMLEKVIQLQAVTFNWRKDEFPEKNFEAGEQIGLIAQDVESILPGVVKTDIEGYKSIDYDKLGVLMVEALKEQQQIIQEQRSILSEQEARLQTLAHRLEKVDEFQKA